MVSSVAPEPVGQVGEGVVEVVEVGVLAEGVEADQAGVGDVALEGDVHVVEAFERGCFDLVGVEPDHRFGDHAAQGEVAEGLGAVCDLLVEVGTHVVGGSGDRCGDLAGTPGGHLSGAEACPGRGEPVGEDQGVADQGSCGGGGQVRGGSEPGVGVPGDAWQTGPGGAVDRVVGVEAGEVRGQCLVGHWPGRHGVSGDLVELGVRVRPCHGEVEDVDLGEHRVAASGCDLVEQAGGGEVVHRGVRTCEHAAIVLEHMFERKSRGEG